jgi:hypothetical protein
MYISVLSQFTAQHEGDFLKVLQVGISVFDFVCVVAAPFTVLL